MSRRASPWSILRVSVTPRVRLLRSCSVRSRWYSRSRSAFLFRCASGYSVAPGLSPTSGRMRTLPCMGFSGSRKTRSRPSGRSSATVMSAMSLRFTFCTSAIFTRCGSLSMRKTVTCMSGRPSADASRSAAVTSVCSSSSLSASSAGLSSASMPRSMATRFVRSSSATASERRKAPVVRPALPNSPKVTFSAVRERRRCAAARRPSAGAARCASSYFSTPFEVSPCFAMLAMTAAEYSARLMSLPDAKGGGLPSVLRSKVIPTAGWSCRLRPTLGLFTTVSMPMLLR
mmetsp:Transcript_8383/g.24172  ORF Transcript_8383/g.24172 Transcript_8383/m.24172 type:complete len:287 (+) Transcript_8383:619-1479(+)